MIDDTHAERKRLELQHRVESTRGFASNDGVSIDDFGLQGMRREHTVRGG